MRRPRRFSKLPVVVFCALLVLIGVVVWQRQNIFDEIRLETYQPPAAITNLVQTDDFTPYAQKLFYINQPQLIGNHTSFSQACQGKGEQTIVLGCYHSTEDGIFLFTVSDPQLDGVEQVTAAHEMLHAAYDRLSSQERNQVNGWLLSYYHHGLNSSRIEAEITAYQQTEPNAWINELHSLFGTEVANLPADLEQYYERYFKDRQKIVTYADAYASAFTARETQVQEDDAQLTSWKNTITADEKTLTSQSAQLQTQQTTLEQLRTSDLAAYNASVAVYNQQVDAYNALVTETKNLVATYNQLVQQRNAIALEAQNLENELSGKLVPMSQQ